MIQFMADLRQFIHQALGFIGYICLTIGVMMLLFSVLGGRFQGEKLMRAAIMIAAGAVLMNLVQAYL